MKPKLIFSKVLWGILTGLFAILTAAIIILAYVANNFASTAINMALNTSNFETIYDSDAATEDFFTTDYKFERNAENMYKEDAATIEYAEAEGAVLLWNKQALPLAGNEKLSLLGRSSADIVECGSGSGYVTTYDYNSGKNVTVTMKDAFESRGFAVNGKLWDFYASGAGSKYKRTSPEGNCTPWQQWKVNEVPWSEYAFVTDSFASYGDAAVVVLSRSGGEYSDLHYNYASTNDAAGNNDLGKMENTSADGGYLGLTDEEDQLLANVTRLRESGTFGKVIVLLNTGNPLQMQDLDKYYAGIDSCMWIGQPGSTGINAVADLLKGKDMSGNALTPSGRLTDTWVYDNNSAPATVNDGNYTYGNADLLSGKLKQNAGFNNKYMVYQEGIYIGYRYYETRYTDCVTGKGNAASPTGAKHSRGGWNYDEEVAFPFGYGLSYTKFDYGNFAVARQGDGYDVTVEVTNSGTVAGKEVVQVYLQKPYTTYDVSNNIEKAAVELAGYAKTSLLAPGGSETVTVSVPAEYFKTYDANGEETYIIEDGTYYLTVATDAHVAANNILGARGFTVAAQQVMGGASNTKPTALGKDFVYAAKLEEDYKTYSRSTQTGYDVYNQLDSGDINKYEHKGDNAVTYLSRSDWAATYPQTAARLSLNPDMAYDLDYDKLPTDDEYDMPVYGVFASGSETGSPDVKNGDLVAYQFINAPLYPEKAKNKDEVYNEADGLTYRNWEDMWDRLLDQMTFEEQAYMIVNAYHWIHGAQSVSLPESRQENGPVGITKRQEPIFSLPNDATIKNGTGWTWVAYPCAGIIAASFNNEVAKAVGGHKSEDMLYLGYNGIYGPGVNMHRSPYGGRAFEYPSEDPFLAGMIEAYECIGIESKGCLAYAKHYALNDMETNRVNCGIWSNEQASREIYLRAFELVFTVGKASATMNSFTRIGTTWNGASYAMMTTILRDEWGFDGLVISDWDTDGSAMSKLDGVLAGTDTFDGNKLADELVKYSDNAAVAQAVRTSAKRIIYNVARTNAMNGMSINSRIIKVTPWWQTALVALQWSFGGVFAVTLGMLTVSIVIGVRNKRRPGSAPPPAT